MAQLTYRGNLSAKTFPFISERFGQSIIVKQYDQNFDRNLQSSEDVDKDIGIPQFYYAHNIMPMAEGLQSVGYTKLLDGGLIDFASIKLLRDDAGNSAYLGITNSGKFYVSSGGVWVYKVTHTGLVTFAFVSGITYIYVQGIGCLKYDFGTTAFVVVTLTGITIIGAGAAIGICPSIGYLICWSSNTVAWSSTIDPTDFTPSLVTGAGGGAVQGVKGAINFCVPHLLGFIVYTTSNAVAALYSGNSRYPFNFREIVSSGGLSSLKLIAADANTGNHYAYTTDGMQLISTSQSQTIFPEITDFISGKLFEDFDTTTNTIVRTVLYSTMKKRLNVISSRYLVMSYGVYSLTHALIYDLVTKRYGKLKITHVDTFEFQIPSVSITEIPRQSIGFLQVDGTIFVLDFDVTSESSSGVLILGKFQFVRSRLLTLDTLMLENIEPGATFELLVATSLDGKNTTNSSPVLLYSSGQLRSYGVDKVGKNHSLICKGSFHLTSFELVFHIHGKY